MALSFIMVAFNSGGVKPLGAKKQVFVINHQAGTGAGAHVSRATRRHVMAKAMKDLTAVAARALEPTSVLIAALRQNAPADADYRSALAELERRCKFYDALDEYMKAIRKDTEAMPDQKVVGAQAYCEAEAGSDVHLNDARFDFESIIYSIIYE
jgi:hypothetical protein